MKAHAVVEPTEILTMPTTTHRVSAEIRIAEDRGTWIVAFSWQLPLAGASSPLSTSHASFRAVTRDEVIRWACGQIRREISHYTTWNGGVRFEEEEGMRDWTLEVEASLEMLDLFEVANG